MELYVDTILAAKPSPFTIIVQLSDTSYGISHVKLEVGDRWNLGDKSGNMHRYANYTYAKAAFYAAKES